MGHAEDLHQRLATIAAIEEAERLARAVRDHDAFIELIALFQQTLAVFSVEELKAIEGQAQGYVRRLRNEPPQP